jgi:hypothetical protein
MITAIVTLTGSGVEGNAYEIVEIINTYIYM